MRDTRACDVGFKLSAAVTEAGTVTFSCKEPCAGIQSRQKRRRRIGRIITAASRLCKIPYLPQPFSPSEMRSVIYLNLPRRAERLHSQRGVSLIPVWSSPRPVRYECHHPHPRRFWCPDEWLVIIAARFTPVEIRLNHVGALKSPRKCQALLFLGIRLRSALYVGCVNDKCLVHFESIWCQHPFLEAGSTSVIPESDRNFSSVIHLIAWASRLKSSTISATVLIPS